MLSDLRFAVRQLVKAPGFTTIAVLSLAVGISATASIFGLVKNLVLDPLPYPESERVGQVWGARPGATFDFQPLSTPDFLDLADQVTGLTAFGAFAPRRFNLGGVSPQSIDGALCTPGVFSVCSVAPLHGRWFTADDVADEASANVVILSHGLWQQRFAASPACLGQTLRLDGRDYTIVGVMPPQFELLSMWTRNRPLALWTPLFLSRADRNRGSLWMSSIARMKPGVTKRQIDSELTAAAERLQKIAPDTNARRTFWFMPLQQGLGGLPALRVSVLLAAGWTLLVLGAQNVAGMMLARSVARQPEITVRVALGASRWRIARLVLAESMLLASLAAGAGLLLTFWCQDGLTAILPATVRPRAGLGIDTAQLGCIAFLAVVVVQMAGLAPALFAAKTEIGGSLKDCGVSLTVARKTQRRLRRLVVVQIALALLLVSIALQLSGTYRQMLASSRALVSEETVTASVAVKGPRYNDALRVAFWDRFVASVAALPGVTDAAVTSKLPFDGGRSMMVLVDDEAFDPSKALPWTEMSYVSPAFFPAIGATLLQGRFLTDGDSLAHRRSVVINRAMARAYWPGQNPIGHHIRPATTEPDWSGEIVGVIDDVRQVAERPAKPEMYYTYADDPTPEAFLVVRTAAGLPAPVEAIREQLRRIEPDLALGDIGTMRYRFEQSGDVISVVTTIVDGITIAILGLVAIGLYGTLSFTFARRRRDIGVRLALGATARDIVSLVLHQVLIWVAIGAAIGLTGAWLIARVTHAMLEDASPVNLAVLGGSLLIVFAVAALAAWLPARRATKVDPIDALRSE